MRQILFYTQAYNAEKTIRRTVESILAQTCPDFKYYVVDNGSTDGTGRIIREYADRDDRVVAYQNKVNHVWEPGHSYREVYSRYDDSAMFCWLDADDEYKSDFIEKMIHFIEPNNLDIACCGSDEIDARTGDLLAGGYRVERDLILDSNNYSRLFETYYQFMYTTWGKLYKISTLKRINLAQYPPISYGWDTLHATEAFRAAERVGILAAPLHRYYISTQSVSHKYDATRKFSTYVTIDAFERFLTEKAGEISTQNRAILNGMYFNNVHRAVQNITQAQVSMGQKLSDLRDILTHRHTAELMRFPDHQDEKNSLFTQAINWVIHNPETQPYEKLTFLAGLGGTFTPLGTGAAMRELLAGEPLLSNLEPEAAAYMSATVSAVLQRDDRAALGALLALAESDIPDEFADAYLTLGMNLSAKLESTRDFLLFKKLHISLLIDRARTDDALAELGDWDEILPDDPEFRALRARLTQ